MTPAHPEGFELVVFVGLFCGPGFDGGEDVAGFASAEFAAGSVAAPVFGEFQVFE